MAIITIPQQNIVVAPTKIQPKSTQIDHGSGQVTTICDVLDANNLPVNKIYITYPISELGTTVVALETAQQASTVVANAAKAAIAKL